MNKCRVIALVLVIVMLLGVCSGFTKGREQIIIYSTDVQSYIDTLQELFAERFPDYDIIIEAIATGQQARLLAEGTDTECDISMQLTYNNYHQLEEAGLLADLSDVVDFSRYNDDVNLSTYYSLEDLLIGAIEVNTDMLEKLGLPEPTSYEDLLDPQYKGLIVAADPRTSGTGYMHLKSLVNAWGDEEAFDYFEKLAENVIQFTGSGSGVTNSVIQGEAAIGLGDVTLATEAIAAGEPLKMLFFEEGAPYTLYGQAIIAGKEERQCVREVFQYMTGEMWEEIEEKFPARVLNAFTDDAGELPEGVPENFTLGDMGNDSAEEQERLLSMWAITG